ncbi:hypothetical protein OKW21_005771 [Catalinimonas alkaloidigena]|uniref:hypothetical protein n=1 Tax=Catalinimonas alkaloidigena TaxID=1075417 RepID=UPI002404D693|nr:hypothetical protein [Catalinimonas alkaloidigena]MDF9800508.1 hypothetical protein [Catalinimonas alkaloidigena]
MTYITKLMCGIILLTVPTIQYGGYFLLQLLAGKHTEMGLNTFQKSMFRAGHAHAGVIVILSLIAQILVDYAALPKALEWWVRIGFPLSAILISGGFFGAAAGKQVTKPTPLIWLLYVGAIVLLISLLSLGIGLIRNNG